MKRKRKRNHEDGSTGLTGDVRKGEPAGRIRVLPYPTERKASRYAAATEFGKEDRDPVFTVCCVYKYPRLFFCGLLTWANSTCIFKYLCLAWSLSANPYAHILFRLRPSDIAHAPVENPSDTSTSKQIVGVNKPQLPKTSSSGLHSGPRDITKG